MIVVTGASGLIGNNLVRILVTQGQPVRAMIHRNQRPLDGLDVEVMKGNLLSPVSLEQVFSGADVVYHLAGEISLKMRDWDQMEKVNVTGTRNVVQACMQSNVRRLIHFSSIHALEQEPFDIPVNETRPRVRSSSMPAYDRSKAAGELEVLKGVEQGLDAVILNPTGILGPFDFTPSYFGMSLIKMAKGKFPALVQGGFDWVDARDAALAAIQASQHGQRGENYLISGHWKSVRQIADLVGEFSCLPSPKLNLPLWLAYAGLPFTAAYARLTRQANIFTRATLIALKSNQHIDHSKATQHFNYQPRPFRETLFDSLRWFVDNGYLPKPVHPTHKQGVN